MISIQANRQQLYDETLNARTELMRALLFLSEEEATTIPVHADWCVRDVISHITARECTALAAFRHLTQEGDPLFLDSGDDRGFNLAAVERRRDFGLSEVIDELDSCRSQLSKLARRLPNNALFAEFEVGHTGRMQSVADVLAEVVNHDYEHAAGIWRWRVANGVLHRDQFFDFAAAERATLLNSLGGLMEDDMLVVDVCGHWTVSQVMAHVLSWDEEALRTVQNWTGDRSWQEGALYDDDWNEAEVVKRTGMSVIDLADGLATVNRRYRQFLEKLSDEELVQTAAAPWGERMALLSFVYEMACHDASHVPNIRALQSRLAI